jgi:tyrosyl-tRNA synthetase
LDAKKTSPYQFYQFWLNASDDDAKKWIKLFTLLSKETIEALIAEHDAAPHQRSLQKKLAEELTVFVHSREDYDFAVKASEILFSNDTAAVLQSLNEEQLLQVLEGVPTVSISKEQLIEGYDFISFLADSQIFPSKGEAKKMLQAGGLAVNKIKVGGEKADLVKEDLLQDKYVLVQKGKKNYYLVVVG